MQYLKLVTPKSGVTEVLGMKKPGTGDVLSLFLAEATKRGNGAVAFQRGGTLGFDVVAVPLAEETMKSIAAATQKFNW